MTMVWRRTQVPLGLAMLLSPLRWRYRVTLLTIRRFVSAPETWRALDPLMKSRMTRFRHALLGLAGAALASCATAAPHTGAAASSPASKPRVVVTTDPELDDSNSLLRYLLYTT